MMGEKFLTVFAVFDNETQKKLKKMQDEILKLGNLGTQTMDIPFHISLGSFPVKDEEELKSKIKKVCACKRTFDIVLTKVNHFNNRVLFIEPKLNKDLKDLHSLFDSNFHGGFSWHAHATMFCGNEKEVTMAKEVLQKLFKPITAKIVSIQMGEFFPTKMLAEEKLQK